MKMLQKQQEIALLKKAIEELPHRGHSDYDTLFRHVGRKYRLIERNAAQLAFLNFDGHIKDKTCVWSRGSGKTTVVADHMDRLIHDMPGSVINFIVPSYKKFLKEMLPPLKKGLEMLGYFEGLHYWIGTKPSEKLNVPIPAAPKDFDNIITWYNGTIIQLISQDINGSGRALSTDAEIRDEALLLDKFKLDETSTATLRGSNVKKFEKCRYFGSKLTLSSMPITHASRWILSNEELALEYPQKFYYSEFNVGVNLSNLRKGYVTDAYNTALYEWLFRAEYLNERPSVVSDAFYSLLNEDKHTYTTTYSDYRNYGDCRDDYDEDNLRPNSPLICGVDWGARINYMVICQLHNNKDERILRAINEFWALGLDKEIQEDMVRKFAEYFRVFKTKRLILFCDRQGNKQTGITNETRIELFINQLTKEGWKIELMSRGGNNPLHSFKRLVWENVLKEHNKQLLKFRINKLSCRNLLISMQNAQTKIFGLNDIRKNKGSEKQNSSIHPTHATDPSDAADYIVTGLIDDNFITDNSPLSAAV